MARWEPGAPQRLQDAALELFATRGYEQTTATEIAESVGLTERTFFRHFSDKREVLFHGQQRFVQVFLDGIAGAPAGAPAMEVVEHTLRSAAAFFTDERREHSRTRQAVIEKNPALQERELHKLANLAGTIADELRARGIEELAATLAGQTALTVFTTAFVLWIREGETRSMAAIQASVLRELVALTADHLGR
jgi:AcrR family transcriptional regulator